MNRLSQAFEAAEFLLSEASRIYALSPHERMARIREDKREGLGMLWGHPKWNPLECGWAARVRFDEIVRFARHRHPDIERDASWETAHKAMVFAFVNRFIEKRAELSSASLLSVVDGACKHIRGSLNDHTLVVPCVLWRQGDQSDIAVGPVTFQRADKFFADETLRFEAVEDLVDKAKQFANESGWVAIVTVPHTDTETAERRASQAIDAAINVLRMLLGPERTRRCRRAEAWGPPGKHSFFRLQPDRRMLLHATWDGREDSMWENWSESVYRGQSELILKLAGAAIVGLVDPSGCVPLQQRFLDALKWYGDAVSERGVGARIAKCVFAWERLVVAGDGALPEGTTQTDIVSERTAMLCEYVHGTKGPELRKKLRMLYDVRSRLVHGSQSPWNEDSLEKFATESEELTVRALIGSLPHYFRLSHGGGTDKDLESSFTSQTD